MQYIWKDYKLSKALVKVPEYKALSRKHRLFIDNLIACNFNCVDAYGKTYPKSKLISTKANSYKLLAKKEIKDALDALVSEGYIISRYAQLAAGKNDDISIKALTQLSKIKGMVQDKPQVLQQFNIDTQNTDKEIIKIIQANKEA
jgi:competence protein ComGC